MIGTTPLPVTLLISDSTALEVDAWGEIALPMGTYPCLRLKTHRFLDVKAFVLGSWVTVSDDNFMIYEWHVRKAGMIMQIASHSGETSETFTEAGLVLRMDDSNVLTGVECDPQCAGESGIPEAFTLMQNYPNPFNPSTTITYALSEPSNADLRIYSLLGQEIMAVSEVKEAGLHRFTWYGMDRLGRQVPGGIYFYRLEAQPLSGGSAFLDIRKMILMK